jgi:hypothetical protein
MNLKKHTRMDLTWRHILHAKALDKKSNPSNPSYLVRIDKVAGRSYRVLKKLTKLDILHRRKLENEATL